MTPGTLNTGEPHPMAHDAYKWIVGLGPIRLSTHLVSFSSCALSGNRLAEVCSETLRRVMSGESVSDRYILGLAWAIKNLESEKQP